jgi:hypothetical protein
MEQLQAMRVESAAKEQKIYDNLCKAAAAWDEQAGQTLLYDKAIEYIKTPPVKHTSNQWETTEYGHRIISNMVYKMTIFVYEKTEYDRTIQKSVPCAWFVSWSIYTNPPINNRCSSIAGQDRKRYTDKDTANKYIDGRVKAYAHLFTDISPPIPQAYAKNFHVNGLLLQGYSVQEDIPKED